MIRPARGDDLDALSRLLLQAHALELSSDISVNVQRGRHMLMQYIVNRDCFSWVADDVSSALFGEVERPWYSNELMASDLFFYGRGAAALWLLRRFIRWSKERGATHIILPITSGLDTERAAYLYESSGLKHAGAVYIGQLKNE